MFIQKCTVLFGVVFKFVNKCLYFDIVIIFKRNYIALNIIKGDT